LKKGPLHNVQSYAPQIATPKNSYGGNKNR
jgi:hypothetical protein